MNSRFKGKSVSELTTTELCELCNLQYTTEMCGVDCDNCELELELIKRKDKNNEKGSIT